MAICPIYVLCGSRERFDDDCKPLEPREWGGMTEHHAPRLFYHTCIPFSGPIFNNKAMECSVSSSKHADLTCSWVFYACSVSTNMVRCTRLAGI